MLKISCPACGGEVSFLSRASVFSVCPYCAQMLVRKDLSLESLGTMAQLPPDQSPLQLMTTGTCLGKNFTLIGRLKLEWEAGYWNEWHAYFDDGSSGWLADAQGFLMMSFPRPNPSALPTAAELRPGLMVQIDGKTFKVDDIKEAVCAGSIGELPFTGAQGRRSTSVDLVGDDQAFASLDYSTEGVRTYVGRYFEFDDFKFQRLREIDGW